MFKVPRIYKPIDLGEYSGELDGIRLYVWVNPPRKLRAEYVRAIQATMGLADAPTLLDRIRRKFHLLKRTDRIVVEWFGKVWSEDGTLPIGPSRAVDFSLELAETDPVLFAFLVDRTVRLLQEHAEDAKKN